MSEEYINQGLISIIIPIYNAQEYISRCLKSIVCQTYQNYEVILVDDGSTDQSRRECDAFCTEDKRFQLYHIENGGVSNARNFGLKQVQGEWFCYIDIDDWIEPDYLKTLYDNAIQYGCDVSACCYVRNSSFEVGSNQTDRKVLLLKSSGECIHNFISSGLSLNGMVWNKLYRTEQFRGFEFDTSIKINEDCLYTYEVMRRCRKACVTSASLYHWYSRNDSACHARPTTLDFSAANVFLQLLKATEELSDRQVEITLKRNYTNSVINMLFYVKYSASDQEVTEAKRRIMEWKKEVYSLMNKQQKMKYVCVMRISFFWNIFRKFIID